MSAKDQAKLRKKERKQYDRELENFMFDAFIPEDFGE